MIIISKVLFGSVALATTLAGTAFLPETLDAARGLLASVQGPADAEPQPAPADVHADAASFHAGQPRCVGACDIGTLLSRIR